MPPWRPLPPSNGGTSKELSVDDHRTPSQPDPAENPALQPILIHDKSLPGKIAEGSEARDVLDQQILVLGAQLVNQLHILLKTIRIHERTNAAVNQVVDATVTTVKTLARDNSVVIRLQNDFLYPDDGPLKVASQQAAICADFIASLN